MVLLKSAIRDKEIVCEDSGRREDLDPSTAYRSIEGSRSVHCGSYERAVRPQIRNACAACRAGPALDDGTVESIALVTVPLVVVSSVQSIGAGQSPQVLKRLARSLPSVLPSPVRSPEFDPQPESTTARSEPLTTWSPLRSAGQSARASTGERKASRVATTMRMRLVACLAPMGTKRSKVLSRLRSSFSTSSKRPAARAAKSHINCSNSRVIASIPRGFARGHSCAVRTRTEARSSLEPAGKWTAQLDPTDAPPGRAKWSGTREIFEEQRKFAESFARIHHWIDVRFKSPEKQRGSRQRFVE